MNAALGVRFLTAFFTRARLTAFFTRARLTAFFTAVFRAAVFFLVAIACLPRM
jgi:hypothetical protein